LTPISPTDEIDLSAIVNKLNGMLNNEKFVSNAPEAVVAENKEALANTQSKLEKVEAELKLFS
jgi:valyl-tRNA synthetase